MLAAIFHVSLPFGMAGKCGMSSAHLWSFLLCEMHQEAQRKEKKHKLAKGNMLSNAQEENYSVGTGSALSLSLVGLFQAFPLKGWQRNANIFLYLFIQFFTLVRIALVLTFWERTSYQFSLAQVLSESEFESHMH